MEIVVINQLRSIHCSAFTLCLLSDNVKHHLENGQLSDRFLAIHSLANAPWQQKSTSVSAGRLHQELPACASLLAGISIAQLAASQRTLSLLDQAPNLEASRATSLVDHQLVVSSSGATRLGDLFTVVVFDLIRLAAEAPARGRLLVRSTLA